MLLYFVAAVIVEYVCGGFVEQIPREGFQILVTLELLSVPPTQPALVAPPENPHQDD